MARLQPSHHTGRGTLISKPTDDKADIPQNGSFLLPSGSEGSRQLVMEENRIFLLGCPGSQFSADGSAAMKTGICETGDLLVEDQNVGASLADFQCKRQPDNEATVVGEEISPPEKFSNRRPVLRLLRT